MTRDPLRRMQRDSYLASRALDDLNALRRGPDVLARRLVRRQATRNVFTLLWKVGR